MLGQQAQPDPERVNPSPSRGLVLGPFGLRMAPWSRPRKVAVL
jgi:hypothetical protein